MSVPASALPRAAQQKLAALQAAETPDNNTPAPVAAPAPAPAASTPAANEPATPAAGTITLSREEYNDLLANAGKTQKALAQAESAKLAQEEMAHRLTELEKAAKSTPAPAAAAPVLASEDVTFTPDEEKEFGDSREFISKVVRQELGKVIGPLNELLADIRKETQAAAQTATQATTLVAKRAETEFFGKVNAAVPNLAAITKHKNWGDFLDETDDLTGITYEKLLGHNVSRENLKAVTAIYKKFSDKYLGSEGDEVQAGYAGGANPSGNAAPNASKPAAPEKLKFSDRKRASEDYRKGRITYDQLQEVVTKFNEAEKLGNVDFDK